MVVIELLQDYQYRSNQWAKGDRPTVRRELAVMFILEGVAKYLAEGCGCPGQADKIQSND